MIKKLAYLNNFSYLCRVIRRYGEGRIIEASADWKIQSELTPRANVSLTPENFLILTP